MFRKGDNLPCNRVLSMTARVQLQFDECGSDRRCTDYGERVDSPELRLLRRNLLTVTSGTGKDTHATASPRNQRTEKQDWFPDLGRVGSPRHQLQSENFDRGPRDPVTWSLMGGRAGAGGGLLRVNKETQKRTTCPVGLSNTIEEENWGHETAGKAGMSCTDVNDSTDPLKNPIRRGTLGKRVNGRPFHSAVFQGFEIKTHKYGNNRWGKWEGDVTCRQGHTKSWVMNWQARWKQMELRGFRTWPGTTSACRKRIGLGRNGLTEPNNCSECFDGSKKV